CSLVASGRLNCLIFTAAGDHRVLLSFPTRRSSDLFHHLILRFCQLIIPVQVVIGAVDCRVQLLAFGLPVILKGGLFDVPAFVSIGGGNVIVVLIANVAGGIAFVVAVVGLSTVPCLADRKSTR